MGRLPYETPRGALLRELLQPPETVLVDAGAEGEWTVARVRIVLGFLLLIVISAHVDHSTDVDQHVISAYTALGAILSGMAVYAILLRMGYRLWIGMLSSLLDVTLVSIALWSYVAAGTPEAVMLGSATFEFYLLAIAATSLRYDRRIVVVAGLFAIAQYAAVARFSASQWGNATLSSFPFEWSKQAVRFILLTAATVLSWESVRRARRLRLLSTTDRLTGLLNRMHFEEHARVELSRAERYHAPLVIAMLDLDHFKKVNDSLGHSAGDSVLATFARTLRASFRSSDIAARYGGEEFVLLMPESEAGEAMARIDSLREAFARVPLAIVDSNEPVLLTFTAGIAAYPQDGLDLETVLRAADRRLLKGKRSGRNCVVGAVDVHQPRMVERPSEPEPSKLD